MQRPGISWAVFLYLYNMKNLAGFILIGSFISCGRQYPMAVPGAIETLSKDSVVTLSNGRVTKCRVMRNEPDLLVIAIDTFPSLTEDYEYYRVSKDLNLVPLK
jgi:hypothetical protein